jgi:hypothetical protein
MVRRAGPLLQSAGAEIHLLIIDSALREEHPAESRPLQAASIFQQADPLLARFGLRVAAHTVREGEWRNASSITPGRPAPIFSRFRPTLFQAPFAFSQTIGHESSQGALGFQFCSPRLPPSDHRLFDGSVQQLDGSFGRETRKTWLALCHAASLSWHAICT